MPKWQHPHARYSTVKSGDKWSVLEEEPNGNKTYLGEFETESDASKKMYELMRQGVSLRQGQRLVEEMKSNKENEKEHARIKTEREEKAEKQRTGDPNILHNVRLEERREELERQKQLLTRHQQRRNERSP